MYMFMFMYTYTYQFESNKPNANDLYHEFQIFSTLEHIFATLSSLADFYAEDDYLGWAGGELASRPIMKSVSRQINHWRKLFRSKYHFSAANQLDDTLFHFKL